jgi:hypothetical protein
VTGREKVALRHSGNLRYRALIDSYRDEFENANVKQKTEITVLILRKILDTNGRFLAMGEDGWKILDDNEARLKIASAFRSKRKAGKRAMIKAMKKDTDSSPQTQTSDPSLTKKVSLIDLDLGLVDTGSINDMVTIVGKRPKV